MHNDLKLENHDLRLNGGPLLSGLGDGTSVVADPDGIGVFLRFAAETPAARHVFPAGSLDGIGRFTCCHRYEPFWMTAKAGTRGGDVPPETQYLLAEREDGVCVLFVPLLDGAFRASLQGSGETGLELVAETGDPAVVGKEVVGLFVAAGPDPYALMERGARSVMHRLGSMNVDNLDASRGYDKWSAYSMSKLANLLFTLELQRRAEAARLDLTSVAAHPGYASTHLQSTGPRMAGRRIAAQGWKVLNLIGQSAARGALPTVRAAVAPDVSGGDYFGPSGPGEVRGNPVPVAMSRAARDPEAAQWLWSASEELTGVRYELPSRDA